MASKKVRNHHPDMERALNSDEDNFGAGLSPQHSSKLFSKPRPPPRQFKNLPGYLQLEPDPPRPTSRSSYSQIGDNTYIEMTNICRFTAPNIMDPVTPDELMHNYFDDEEAPPGEEDDPPLVHSYDKSWRPAARQLIQPNNMVHIQDPAPPAYQAIDGAKPKRVNRSGSGKKKSAKAKKKAAKAKRLAKLGKSSTTTKFNNDNAKTTTTENTPTTSTAGVTRGLGIGPRPPPYDEIQQMNDVLIKIRVFKPFDNEAVGDKAQMLYRNAMGIDRNKVPDIRKPTVNSKDDSTAKNQDKDEDPIVNDKLSADMEKVANEEVRVLKIGTVGPRPIGDGKPNWMKDDNDFIKWTKYLEDYPGACIPDPYILSKLTSPDLKYCYDYILNNQRSIGLGCSHLPVRTGTICKLCLDAVALCHEANNILNCNHPVIKREKAIDGARTKLVNKTNFEIEP